MANGILRNLEKFSPSVAKLTPKLDGEGHEEREPQDPCNDKDGWPDYSG